MSEMSAQRELFERIHDKYYAATSDPIAEAYKGEFVMTPVLQMLGPNVRDVVELACGDGAGSLWLQQRRPELRMAGMDISDRAAESYRSRTGRPCERLDLTRPQALEARYDAAVVFGGIHHLVENLDAAFGNIAAMLRPGGVLIMSEPSADFVLEPVRKLWYRLDREYFSHETEWALSHHRLAGDYAHLFRPEEVRYAGGPGSYVLMHNWALRMPHGVKSVLAPFCTRFERAYARMPGRWPFSSFTAKWVKADAPA